MFVPSCRISACHVSLSQSVELPKGALRLPSAGSYGGKSWVPRLRSVGRNYLEYHCIVRLSPNIFPFCWLRVLYCLVQASLLARMDITELDTRHGTRALFEACP